jgi:tetratricopeptide (TPR) repeat protein
MPEGSPERKEKIEQLNMHSRRRRNLFDATENIYELFRTFPRRSRRMVEAERRFLDGDFIGMDDVLQEEEIMAEINKLKEEQKQELFISNWQQMEILLREKSYELLLKGLLHYTHVDNPIWYKNFWRLITEALDASVNTHTLCYNGWYCIMYKYFDRAKEFYTDAIEERWTEENLSDESRLFFEAKCHRYLGYISFLEENLPEAIRSVQRSLTLFTKLKDINPAVYFSDVAETLTMLGDYHTHTEAYSVALVEYEEALRIRRRLAVDDGEAYLPVVAGLLNSLGIMHVMKKEYRDAIACCEEAISIERNFLELNRQAFMSMLTNSINNMTTAYFMMNKREKLIPLLTELVAIYRELAVTEPDIQRPRLAYALCQIAIQRRFWKEHEEAYRDMEEGIALYRESALQSPSKYLPLLAKWLSELDDWHWNDGNREASFELCCERTDVYRRLAEESPEKYLPKLGETLDRLAAIYHDRGDDETSLTIYLEGIEVIRRLVEQNRRYGHILGILLMGLSVYYSNIFPDREKALAAAKEACTILQPFRKQHPTCEKSYKKAKEIIRSLG